MSNSMYLPKRAITRKVIGFVFSIIANFIQMRNSIYLHKRASTGKITYFVSLIIAHFTQMSIYLPKHKTTGKVFINTHFLITAHFSRMGNSMYLHKRETTGKVTYSLLIINSFLYK